MKIYDLRTEYLKNPMGIDQVLPRLSWKIEDMDRNIKQVSYQIKAYADKDKIQLVWDSGKVLSDQSQYVRWNGPELKSRDKIYWKVKVSAEGVQNNEKVNKIAESEFAEFEMGLLSVEDWKAEWIEPEDIVDITISKPAPYLRKEFEVKEGLCSAKIYQSAHGLYEFWINGEKGTEDVFKPGFTSYYKRIQYQVYDIKELLKEGQNCWTVILGDGWWRGTVGGTQNNNFGYKVAYIGQIELTYEDGTKTTIGTDETFRTSTGAILQCDMILGEVYNAQAELDGWKNAGYDDSSWEKVHRGCEGHEDKNLLIASRSVPIREKEKLIPEILHTPDGSVVLDYGQNIAGYIRMNLRGCQKGQKIKMTYGEALDENGNFTTKNFVMTELAKKFQHTEYIASGKTEEHYQPLFSIFGFQYVKIEGYNKEVCPEDFTAIAVYSDLDETGEFQCSNKLINQLVSNTRWSQKGNFMDVPTDCPTRERSPWTGDAQVYGRTATDFMNVYTFFEKWLLDFNEEQYPTGKIPNTVPTTNSIRHNFAEQKRVEDEIAKLENETEKQMQMMCLGTREKGSLLDGSSGWGDAATILPYTMYLCYGDKTILENQYSSAKKWVDYIVKEAKVENPVYAQKEYYSDVEDAQYVWDTDYHWGEWLEADKGGYEDLTGLMNRLFTYPEYITATMYYFYSAKIVSEMAGLLKKKEDEKKYKKIAENVKRVFNKYFIHADGMIEEGRQAPNVRAIAFGLVDEDKKDAVAAYLNKIVVDNGYKLNTGFLSTPFLLPVLSDCGYKDTAFAVLEQTESPSWLKPVKDGATTIMENWTAYEKCDASYNHYSYGAVCDFLFSGITGIRPVMEHPGYKHFLLKPAIGGSLTNAKAVYESGYGKIVSGWNIKEDKVEYYFEIPANTTATIILEVKQEVYKELQKRYSDMIYKDNCIYFETGSGIYSFSIKKN